MTRSARWAIQRLDAVDVGLRVLVHPALVAAVLGGVDRRDVGQLELVREARRGGGDEPVVAVDDVERGLARERAPGVEHVLVHGLDPLHERVEVAGLARLGHAVDPDAGPHLLRQVAPRARASGRSRRRPRRPGASASLPTWRARPPSTIGGYSHDRIRTRVAKARRSLPAVGGCAIGRLAARRVDTAAGICDGCARAIYLGAGMDRVETGMGTVELSAGTVEVRDTGGDGPVVVLIGGLAIGPSLWREVVDDLRADHRCVVPTLPWGAHRIPMRPGADLTLRGHAALVAELLEALDLRDVVLVENDTGMAQLVAADHAERLAGLVLTSCEAFDNYPPGLAGQGGRPAGPAPRRPVPGHAAAAAPAAAPHPADLRVDVPAPDPRRRARRLAAPAPDRPRDPPRSRGLPAPPRPRRPARRGRAPARLRPPRARGLGRRRPAHARRARPPARRPAAAGRASSSSPTAAR